MRSKPRRLTLRRFLDLAFHAWYEPPERLLKAAEQAGIRVVIPEPGQTVDAEKAGTAAGVTPWWRRE